MLPSKLADDFLGVRVPGQRRRAGGQIVTTGEIEKAREQRSLADVAGRNQLRHCKGLNVGPAGFRFAFQIDESECTIGGAEVDADEITGHAVQPTHIQCFAATRVREGSALPSRTRVAAKRIKVLPQHRVAAKLI